MVFTLWLAEITWCYLSSTLRWMRPALTPARQASNWFTYLRCNDGTLSRLWWLVMYRDDLPVCRQSPIEVKCIHVIFTCDSGYCCSSVLAIALLSIHLSVCHTGGSVKNGASEDHQIFTVGCLEDSSFRICKAFP